VLREIDADVIGLQELDSHSEPGSVSEQMLILSDALEMAAAPGLTIVSEERRYGNALLTRAKLLAVRRVDISVCSFEPRGILDADLRVGTTCLRVLVTHLGRNRLERRWQSARLLDVLADGPGGPAVLTGDLNEWWPVSSGMRAIRRVLPQAKTVRSFPAGFPLLSLDQIRARPPARIRTLWSHRSPLSRVASDHLPVVAELEV